MILPALKKKKDNSDQLPRLLTSFGEGNGTPLQYSCLENPMDGGAWKAAVHGVAEGQIRLSDFTFTFYFHALEKEMATHSSVLAWRIPGTAEPGGLPSMGSHRVGHDWSALAAAAAEPRSFSPKPSQRGKLKLRISEKKWPLKDKGYFPLLFPFFTWLFGHLWVDGNTTL